MKPDYNDNPEQKLMEQPSYDKVVAIDLTGGNWNSSTEGSYGMYVCEVRAHDGNLIVDTVRSANVTIPCGNYDIFRVRVTRIYATSTATNIVVFGYDNNADFQTGD